MNSLEWATLSGSPTIQPFFCNQKLSRSRELQQLEKKELEIIDKTVKGKSWQDLYCHNNVAEILQLLPYEISKKLKVVLTTHELEQCEYYGLKYSFHIFLLGNTKSGPIIVDPINPYMTIADADCWLRWAISREDLRYFIASDYNLRLLPQFRFIDGDSYLSAYESEIKAYSDPILTPNRSIQYQDHRCYNQCLWNNSFFLNMCETYQCFSGKITFAETVSRHMDGFVSPNSRLTNDCIRELKDVLELNQ